MRKVKLSRRDALLRGAALGTLKVAPWLELEAAVSALVAQEKDPARKPTPWNEIGPFYTGRERLLAMLALFFGVVALSLAGVGLYGVLDYSVLQRRREIAIRIAIGAQATDIARRVIMGVFVVVLAGSLFGIILGIASIRFIETLLFEVKATDVGVLALPTVAMLAVALLAALPAVIRAVRIDPVTMLRSD
jgi:ABC-type antimicrobial peptide transport system permease subunit